MKLLYKACPAIYHGKAIAATGSAAATGHDPGEGTSADHGFGEE
jgi:hypothetical protein